MNEFDSTTNDTTTNDAVADEDVVDPAEVTAAVARFGRQLRVVRRHAGDPSLRDMVHDLHRPSLEDRHRRVRAVSVSTLGRALAGKKFPKWSVVDALLIACRADDETRTKVQHAWYTVAEMIDPIGAVDDEDELHDAPVPTAVRTTPTLRIVGEIKGTPGRRRNTS